LSAFAFVVWHGNSCHCFTLLLSQSHITLFYKSGFGRARVRKHDLLASISLHKLAYVRRSTHAIPSLPRKRESRAASGHWPWVPENIGSSYVNFRNQVLVFQIKRLVPGLEAPYRPKAARHDRADRWSRRLEADILGGLRHMLPAAAPPHCRTNS
jgi:hypothetical protein